MIDSRRNDVDVVVLDLDGGAMLEECLASIERQTAPANRVIVWDNGSSVPVTSRLTTGGRVEVLRSERNLGFAAGMNAALRSSHAALVALVNNDVVLEPGWLATLAEEMERFPRLAAAQSVILRTDGRVDGAGIDLSDGTIRQRGYGSEPGALSGRAWGVSATAAIYRRAALDEVARGGAIFDERLFAYYEDVELCARLIAAGWETSVLAQPLATHRGSSTAGTLGRKSLRLRVRNRWLVHRMHPIVGRSAALLGEDSREIARSLLRMRIADALVRAGAVVAGALSPLH